MAKITLKASAYRVARGKAEIAKDQKWLKRAKLTTKKSQELKKIEPAGRGVAESGGPDQAKTPGAENSEKLAQRKAAVPEGSEAPDKKKER